MATVVPHWLLRRLSSRFIRVVRRRAASSTAIEAFAQLGVPKAEAYVSTYDKCQKYAADWKREMKEGRGAVTALLTAIRAWVPQVRRDVPGFDASTFADRPDVPDDVIEDAERLLGTIEDYRDTEGKPLSYQTVAVDALNRTLRSAIKEWTEAEAADSAYQQLLASVREQAAAMQAELVALRRTLIAVVGRTDRDYQKLRVERGVVVDEDDDPAAPLPPSIVVSAPAEGAPAAVPAGGAGEPK